MYLCTHDVCSLIGVQYVLFTTWGQWDIQNMLQCLAVHVHVCPNIYMVYMKIADILEVKLILYSIPPPPPPLTLFVGIKYFLILNMKFKSHDIEVKIKSLYDISLYFPVVCFPLSLSNVSLLPFLYTSFL